jgi:hypothetical protein
VWQRAVTGGPAERRAACVSLLAAVLPAAAAAHIRGAGAKAGAGAGGGGNIGNVGNNNGDDTAVLPPQAAASWLRPFARLLWELKHHDPNTTSRALHTLHAVAARTVRGVCLYCPPRRWTSFGISFVFVLVFCLVFSSPRLSPFSSRPRPRPCPRLRPRLQPLPPPPALALAPNSHNVYAQVQRRLSSSRTLRNGERRRRRGRPAVRRARRRGVRDGALLRARAAAAAQARDPPRAGQAGRVGTFHHVIVVRQNTSS